MIKYKLACKDCKIQFDSWFASSSEYEKLKKRKFLTCHNCNSIKVEKTLMAPQLINTKLKSDIKLDTAKYKKIKKLLKIIKSLLRTTFNMLGIILLTKQDPFIITTKKSQKEYMEVHQIKILKS